MSLIACMAQLAVHQTSKLKVVGSNCWLEKTWQEIFFTSVSNGEMIVFILSARRTEISTDSNTWEYSYDNPKNSWNTIKPSKNQSKMWRTVAKWKRIRCIDQWRIIWHLIFWDACVLDMYWSVFSGRCMKYCA